MPNKEFLEKYPLYKECEAENSLKIDSSSLVAVPVGYATKSSRYFIDKPSINAECLICNQVQTYNMSNDYGDYEFNPAGNIFQLVYFCAGCNKSTKYYFVYFFTKEEGEGDDKEDVLYMKKVGQYPAWSIYIDGELKDIVGESVDLYKKGLACESQSYGIGAYAYYRRITEDIIDELLQYISSLIDSNESEAYEEALKEVEKAKNATDKIELVKDLLPKSLKPENLNPLGILHDALSIGLHNETDEECLDKAEDIKGALTFLVNQVARHEDDTKKFTDRMQKILQKKSEKIAKNNGYKKNK